MNPLKWSSIDFVADASRGQLASRINSQLSLHPLTSIGCTYNASLRLQSVAVQSGQFPVLRCRDVSLAGWPLESAQDHLCYRQPQFNRLIKAHHLCKRCSQICMISRE